VAWPGGPPGTEAISVESATNPQDGTKTIFETSGH